MHGQKTKKKTRNLCPHSVHYSSGCTDLYEGVFPRKKARGDETTGM